MDKAYAIGLVAAISIVAGGAFVACSSSSDTGGGTTTDSGVHGDTGTTGNDTGTTTDSGVSDDTGTSGDTGSGGTDCGSDPTLHPTEAGVGPFCPGFKPDGGTSSGSCPAGQVCCEQTTSSSTPSSCAASTSACPTGDEANWECDSPGMCSGSTAVCCGNGTPAVRTGCTYQEVFPAKGTVCAASCDSTQFIVCEGAGDCPTGKTCTPLKTGGKQIGACL